MSKSPQPVVSMKRDLTKKEWKPEVEKGDWIRESVGWSNTPNWFAPFKCEVFADLPGLTRLKSTNGVNIAYNGVNELRRFPCTTSTTDAAYFNTVTSAEVRYLVDRGLSVVTAGWMLDKGEPLYSPDYDWVVRYRRVG